MDERIIWAAGFIDGEGCITIKKGGLTVAHRQRYTLSLSVSQVKLAPLLILRELFGGSITESVQINQWGVASRQAASALKQLEPFLVNKKSEAIVALEFASVMPSKRISKRDTDIQLVLGPYYSRLRELKMERV